MRRWREAGGPGTEGYCTCPGEKAHTPGSDKPNFIQKSILVITTERLNEAHRSPLPNGPHSSFPPLLLSFVERWKNLLGLQEVPDFGLRAAYSGLGLD